MLSSSFGSLEGQVAVVTGSSSGIGKAIALELAEAGAAIVVHAGSNRAGAEEVAERVRAVGREAEVLLADLRSDEDVDRLVQRSWSRWGRVDVWVNNAGADVLTGDASALSFDQKLELLWMVDVRGTVRASREIGLRMRRRGSGVILNMGWDQASGGMAGDSGEMFAAVKGAVAAFTRSLARSLAPEVRVNCLAPGWIKTAWGEGASDTWQRRAIEESLLERWGEPRDVARAARFLASPAAAFVTGQVLPVNGGFKHSGRPA